MTSALKGGGGQAKADKKEHNQLIYVHDEVGREGQKIRKFCGRHIWKPPNALKCGAEQRCKVGGAAGGGGVIITSVPTRPRLSLPVAVVC